MVPLICPVTLPAPGRNRHPVHNLVATQPQPRRADQGTIAANATVEADSCEPSRARITRGRSIRDVIARAKESDR